MKNWAWMNLFLGILFSLNTLAGPGIFGGDDDIEPFPWGTPCAFDMSDFSGIWKAKAFDGEGHLYYEISVKSTQGTASLVTVVQYLMDQRGHKYPLLSGGGQFVAGGEQINVGLLPIDTLNGGKLSSEAEPEYVYLYFGSYCSLQTGLRTYTVSRREAGQSPDEEDVVDIELERVIESEDPELQSYNSRRCNHRGNTP